MPGRLSSNVASNRRPSWDSSQERNPATMSGPTVGVDCPASGTITKWPRAGALQEGVHVGGKVGIQGDAIAPKASQQDNGQSYPNQSKDAGPLSGPAPDTAHTRQRVLLIVRYQS